MRWDSSIARVGIERFGSALAVAGAEIGGMRVFEVVTPRVVFIKDLLNIYL